MHDVTLWHDMMALWIKLTHLMHINTMSVAPNMLESLQYIGSQGVRDVMKSNELLDLCYLSMVARLCCVQSIDNNSHIAKDTGIN